MHHCSALPATFNCYCHSISKISKMNHCSALPATFNCYFHQTRKPRKMNHCSALPATCTPPPLPASGPRTLLKSTRPLSAFPPAHSQPHLIWHDALHPSPGHKVAIVALVRRASRPLAETASSLAAVDRPPAFQLPATCIQMRLSAPLRILSPQIPVHIPPLRSHPQSTVQDPMYPTYAHQLPLPHCSCHAITIPSPHTGLHVSVYQPPTHVHPDSTLHPLEHPSPSSRFPSSKRSGLPRALRPCSP